MSTRIDSDHITFTGDGHAWLVIQVAPPATQSGTVRSPWFALDRACDTCNGVGLLNPAIDGTECSDCTGTGRFGIEIEVPTYGLRCEACGGSAPLPLEMECYQHNPQRITVTRRVSVVPGMVLPIQADNANYCETVWDRGDGTFWYVTASAHHQEPPEGYPADLPSAAKPGDWAVQLKVAS